MWGALLARPRHVKPKLSLATRIFLGYAVVLVTFGAVSLFSVAELHRNRVEIRLVSQGYLQLSQDAAALETFHTNQVNNTERLLQEPSAVTRRALIPLDRLHLAPVAGRLREAQGRAARLAEDAPRGEAAFVRELQARFAELSHRAEDRARATEALYAQLAAPRPDAEALARATAEVRQRETAMGRELRVLRASLDARIRLRVDGAQERERRTGLAIITLSLLAIGVGLTATAVSARALRPVRDLTTAVSRIRAGDFTAQLGVRGHDEVAVLAREFDAMAKALQARERELKAQQEVLLRAQQLAAVGRISAQVAHEVRNPLSSIGLNAELLEDLLARARFEDPAEAREARALRGAIASEVDRLTEVTEQYLRLARPPSPTLAPEDLREVASGVLDFAAGELARAGVDVVRDFRPDTPHALADEAQVRQVLLNLLRNAREAMPRGGRVTVSTGPAADGAGAELRVHDSGPGMAPEVQERVFEPFFTTKQGGTGLGLAVSQQILQAHGGSLTCHSAPGEGTTFVLRLPPA